MELTRRGMFASILATGTTIAAFPVLATPIPDKYDILMAGHKKVMAIPIDMTREGPNSRVPDNKIAELDEHFLFVMEQFPFVSTNINEVNEMTRKPAEDWKPLISFSKDELRAMSNEYLVSYVFHDAIRGKIAGVPRTKGFELYADAITCARM